MSFATAETTRKSRVRSLLSNLGTQIAIGMIIGIIVGLLFPSFAVSLKILGDIFLRLIKVAVAPLIFTTIVIGIISAGNIRKIGKIGVISLLYFEIVSTLALAFGLLFAHLFSVGNFAQISLPEHDKGVSAFSGHGADISLNQFLTSIFPDSFFGAFSTGNMLQVLVIAVIFGLGIVYFNLDQSRKIESALETTSEALFGFIGIIMKLAPIGTFGAIAYAIGANGSSVIGSLALLVIEFIGIVLAFILIVFGGISILFKINLVSLVKFLKEEILILLGTASSESVLPRLLQKLPQYGVSKQVAGLVLPLGYAFNTDGTSLFLTTCVVFLSNVYHIDLSLSQEIGILAIMLLTSKGSATVSGGSLITLAATVTMTGILPIEGLALIFGVYRFMSMALSVCNLIGHAIATIVIAKLNGEFEYRDIQSLISKE